MKKILLGAAALLCLVSCSYRVFPASTVKDMVMQTAEEAAAKENIEIFLSEQEVSGPYKLIAFLENVSPFPANSLKQAVLKANELGGNAIIVNSMRSVKVIELSGKKIRKAAPTREVLPQPKPETRTVSSEKEQYRVQREPRPQREPREKGQSEFGKLVDKVKNAPIFQKKETPAETTPVETKPAESKTVVTKVDETAPANSPVFDESTLQWFTSGYVYRAKEQEQIEIIDAMNEEIRNDLKVCKTKAEADFITKKIEQLEKYNNTLPIPSGTQAGKIKGYRNMLKKLAAKF